MSYLLHPEGWTFGHTPDKDSIRLQTVTTLDAIILALCGRIVGRFIVLLHTLIFFDHFVSPELASSATNATRCFIYLCFSRVAVVTVNTQMLHKALFTVTFLLHRGHQMHSLPASKWKTLTITICILSAWEVQTLLS
jgi:hypothetical protein